jgi:serine/threonine protein phosphatase PrpC
MKYEIATYSRTGGRRTNQDRVLYSEKNNSILIALADGLGGHVGGEVAAEIATEYAIHAYKSIRQPVITQPSTFLALTVIEAHKQIYAKTRKKFPGKQPRTTLVLCLVQEGYAYWAHVGDSRLYHIRHQKVETRTIDHSPVERMHQQGLISEEDMKHHPKKSYLSNCIGGKHKPSITLGEETKLLPGDNIMLCSDGVWEALNKNEFIPYLEYADLDEGLEELLHAAENKMSGASDNITVASLRWLDDVTTAKPLQGDSGKTVDQQSLWDEAKQKIKAGEANKPEPTGKNDPQDHQQQVIEEAEKTLQDIEEFIKSRNSKS